jgi:tetrahydromethanopterin S-methyltransferase subunit A
MEIYNNKKILFYLTIILAKSKIKQNKIKEKFMITKVRKNNNLGSSKLLSQQISNKLLRKFIAMTNNLKLIFQLF